LLEREEEGRAEDRRDHGAQRREEDGREICDSDARRRQRSAEDYDPRRPLPRPAVV
jgi:hypothetical protein